MSSLNNQNNWFAAKEQSAEPTSGQTPSLDIESTSFANLLNPYSTQIRQTDNCSGFYRGFKTGLYQ